MSKTKSTVAIITDNDNDGLMAAAYVGLFESERGADVNVILTRSHEKKRHPEILKDTLTMKADKVYVLDLTLKEEVMEFLHEKYGTDFIWIDHHISSRHLWGKYEGIQQSIEGVSAARLVHHYLDPESSVPTAIRLVSAYDTFHDEDQESFEDLVIPFQIALERMRNLLVYQVILMNEDNNYILETGRLMWIGEKDDYQRKKSELILSSPVEEVYTIMAFPDVRNIGRIAYLVRKEQNVDVDFVVSVRKNPATGLYSHGVRSVNGSSALQYVNELLQAGLAISGGGHEMASGFASEINLFEYEEV